MIGIYFKDEKSNQGFRIPINPPELPRVLEGDDEEFDINTTGMVSVPKSMKLPEVSFSSYFPGDETHYAEVDFVPPSTYIDLISKWMENKTVVRFIYVGGSFTINELVRIKSFEFKDQFGTNDVDYTLGIKKYVDFGFKKLQIVKPAASNKPATNASKPAAKKEAEKRPETKAAPQTYNLVKGDSLWKIAQKYTGNGSNYKALQTLNGIKDSQLRKLPIGLKVKIPPEWSKK